jgi:hypothetical protein
MNLYLAEIEYKSMDFDSHNEIVKIIRLVKANTKIEAEEKIRVLIYNFLPAYYKTYSFIGIIVSSVIE